MNHCRLVPIDRNPIIKRLGLARLYPITIVSVLGLIAFACSESSDDSGGTGGIAGTTATAGMTAGTATAGTTAGTPGIAGAPTAGATAGTQNVTPPIDAGSDGNFTGTDSGTVTGTDAAIAPTDTGTVSSDCSGNYWDITYELPLSDADPGYTPGDVASLKDPPLNQNILLLRGTMMGMGDGNFNIGPGTAKVRFENVDGQPGGKAYLLEFTIQKDFTQTVGTNVNTKLLANLGHEYTEGPCGSSAVGNRAGDTLTWSDFPGTAQGTDLQPNAHAYYYEGEITCEGALCGQFGAPAAGTTPNSGGPNDVRVEPWVYTADGSTFFTPPFIYQSDDNSETSIQVYGVETARECTTVPACE